MNIKNLFFFSCLIASTLLGANNTPLPTASSAASIFDGGACDLPAPLNFHIEELGTTWVKYAWGANAGFEHRIRTYRTSDNALLNTTNVPPGTSSAVINGLPPGTSVYGIINAVCPPFGENSPNEAQSAPGTTLIVDLIVNGIHPPGGGVGCTLFNDGQCEFSGNPAIITNFRVTKIKAGPNAYRNFGMNYSGVQSSYRAYFEKNNAEDTSPFDFKCASNNSGPTCFQTEIGEIWDVSGTPHVKVITFDPIESMTTMLNLDFLASGYKIEILGSYGGFRSVDPSRSASISPSPSAVLASPNPFSNILEVFPAQINASRITLQLFNLSGQKVIDQQFPGGQEQYALSTESLSPGFYMLRIEADGEVQTLKVVKSE
ncbi:MAG: T9SS type A sorting domain-containing protein [Saprospiraceae bacterium]